jgi:ABC-2 type transport system permease protein
MQRTELRRLAWLRHNLMLYLRLINVQIHSQLQYPASFWLDVVGTGVSLAAFFVSLALILQRFGNLGGWTIGEIAFLFGLLEASFGLMDMVFAGFDPSNFGRRVRRGTFDQLLLRPVNITLQVLGDDFILRRTGRIAQGAVIFFIGINAIDIHWTLGKLFYLPFVVLGIVLFFGGLFIIGSTITFWTIDSIEIMNIFTYGSSELISYPMHIYPDWLRSFFTFILPAALLNYYPALYFLDKADPLGMPPFMPFLSPLAGLLILLIGLLFWRFGIRHYQSTGT